jgi:8-oxo-dGTP pyrophosphatase MutT (NUDIX family)
MSGLVKHFTSSAYVVYEDKILLHWHLKVKEYLPPGGHINEDEDPIETVKREVKEETGLEVTIVENSRNPSFEFKYPIRIQVPELILIEEIQDAESGFHKHIDFIYICIPKSLNNLKNNWIWFSEDDLYNGLQNKIGDLMIPPEDVRELGLYAISELSRKKQ